jgi:hypothetical protein
MRNIGWLFIVVGTWSLPATIRAADSTRGRARGPERAPGWLVTVIPAPADVLVPRCQGGVAGRRSLTVYDEHGTGDRIFLYTRSRTFRCGAPRARTRTSVVEAGIDHRPRSVASATRSG